MKKKNQQPIRREQHQQQQQLRRKLWTTSTFLSFYNSYKPPKFNQANERERSKRNPQRRETIQCPYTNPCTILMMRNRKRIYWHFRYWGWMENFNWEVTKKKEATILSPLVWFVFLPKFAGTKCYRSLAILPVTTFRQQQQQWEGENKNSEKKTL